MRSTMFGSSIVPISSAKSELLAREVEAREAVGDEHGRRSTVPITFGSMIRKVFRKKVAKVYSVEVFQPLT